MGKDKLGILNFNGVILIGIIDTESSDKEIILKGTVQFEPGNEGMQLSLFPLGSMFLSPDMETETRLPKNLVPCYTVLDLEDKNQEICIRYRGFWNYLPVE